MTLKLTTQEALIQVQVYEPVRRIQLVPGAVLRLPYQRHTIRLIFGTAWITAEGQDFILRRGAEVSLKPDRYGALISSLDERQLIFDIEELA